jgi:diguanylate cyclase (GGDEF)-like protein
MSHSVNRFSGLRFKIIGSLALVLSLSMGAALFGVWTYQRDRLLAVHHEKAKRTGQVIVAGLYPAMLENNNGAIQRSLMQMAKVDTFLTLSLLNKEGRIIHSSDLNSLGKTLDKQTNPTCTVCHGNNNPPREQAVVLSEFSATPILRTIIPVKNDSECHGCHGANQKLNGILLVDDSLAGIYDMLKTVTRRIILTSAVTLVVLIILISSIVTRFVTMPVKAFMEGISRIEKGDYKTWLDVKGSGEFVELADSFNMMTQAISRLVRELEEKNKKIHIFYTIVRRLSETIDLKKIKSVLADLLCDFLKAESVVLCFPIEKQDRAFEITSKEVDDKRHYYFSFSLDDEVVPHPAVLREELEHWLQGELKAPLFTDDDTKVLIPLQFTNIQLGLICAVKAKSVHFSPAEKRLLPDLAKHISVSYANARLYNLATTDDLTGLYTKGFFETKIKELVDTFNQTHESFSVLMVDLDHFKEVNDTFGHQVGDKVLQQFGELMRENLRHIDICSRYGGEEFVVLLPGEKIRSASIIANRLREKIARFTFQFEGIPSFHKTVSIGIASCPVHATSPVELVAMADEAMYTAKQKGRNMVYFKPVV